MAYNAERVVQTLKLNYDKITFDVKVKERSLYVTADLSINGLDDSVYFNVELFENKVVIIEFVFDKLDKTLRSYELINKFNEESYFLKASITTRGENDDDYLRIAAKVMNAVDEDNAYDNIDFALGQIFDDDLFPIIKDLCALTY